MPSGTDAYHINGNAFHSVLYLPVGTSKCLPLHDERLKDIQETFSNGGLLFIDEKSMTGQKTFTVVRKRLQETRPNYKDKSFGNISWGRQAAATNLRFSAIQSKCRCSQRIQHIPDFFTMPSPSPNLCDINEQTNQTPEDR